MDIRKSKVIFIILFGVFFAFAIFLLKINCDKNSQRYYAQGIEFYKQGKYSDAYYNFKQINFLSKLYSVSLIKQYQCASKLNDKRTAHIKLKELLRFTKNKNLKPYLLYNETNLAYELKFSNSIQTSKKYRYINEMYPESDFAIASAYKMAKLIEKKDKNRAKEKYIQYLEYAPSGKYSLSALDSIKEEQPFLTKEDYEIIAKSYLANSKYQEALNNFSKASFSNNWFEMSKCYRALNNSALEKETILKGLSLETSKIEEKNISYAIDRLAILMKTNKPELLQSLYTQFPNSYTTPTITYKLAETSATVRAIKFYENIVYKYPNSIWASNSLWELFWHNFNFKRYKTCEQLAKLHYQNYPKTKDAPRIQYWYAKALLEQRRHQNAKDVFYKTINEYPLSYYAFLSARELKKSKAAKMIVRKPIADYDFNSLNKYLFENELLFLANEGDFETIDELKINDEYIKSWILHKKENYAQAINIARNFLSDEINESKEEKITFANPKLKLIYPILYNEEINELAQEYSQSPYLFLSLVKEESHFNKQAKSSVGALGLAQIMPATASFIENTPISTQALYNPENNLNIGLKYFDYLVNYFNHNEFYAIISYNAGQGNVKKWIENPSIFSEDIDIFVENIPFLETKEYIKKILSTYWIYLNIYSNKNIN